MAASVVQASSSTLQSSFLGSGSTRLHSNGTASFLVSKPRKVSRITAMASGNTRIHRLLNENKYLILPGCYDALSALIIEQSGFQAGFISGYATAAAKLGKPDIGLLTPTEMCATARYVCAAAPSTPIFVDADTGGGNALNVQRTVKDLIAAGAAGCFIEDQVWPKKCGHMRGKQVIPAEEAAVKIAAARDAIGDADFFLVARTDARATSQKRGLADAIARANLYMDAGADGCFVEAPRDVEELREIGRNTRGFRVCNMLEGGVTPLLTPQELSDLGFHLIVNPLTGLYASTRALIDIHKELKQKGTTRGAMERLATFTEFNALVSLDDWYATEAKYQTPKIVPATTPDTTS
ncbi:unnamed protein product [Closterium sp. NIES-54]